MFKEIITKKSTVAKKLLSGLLLGAMLPLILFGYLSYYNSIKTVEEEVTNNLISIADNKARQIEKYIQDKEKDVIALARIPTIIYDMEKFIAVFKKEGIESLEYSDLDKEFRPFLTYYQKSFGYYDLFLISSEGDIVFTIIKENNLGGNLKTGLYKNSELAKVFDSAQTLLKTRISDFKYHPPSNEPAAFIAAPVLKEEVVIGTIAFQVDNKEIFELLQDYTGLGKTGETLIGAKIGNEVVFLSPLRHDPYAAFRRKITIGSDEALPIQEAVQRTNGSGLSIDYRGKEILAVWRYLPSPKWGMVVKIDTKEAFAPVINIRNWSLIIGIITAFVVILVALFISKSISNPIQALHKGAEIIGSGDLDHKIGIASKDEIGQLSRAFDKMTESLKATTVSRDELAKEITERKRVEEELRRAQEELEQKVKERTAELTRVNEQLRQEIQERKRAEEAIRLNESRLEALLKLSDMKTSSIEDIADFVLEEGVKLTRSKIGFLGFMKEDESVMDLHSWSKSIMKECTITDRPIQYPIEKAGLWGESIRQKKPVIINDYLAPNAYKKGYPEGHVKLIRLMVLPITDSNRVVTVVAVGNKEREYYELDLRQLKLLMDGMWEIIKRKRAEEALQESEKQLQVLSSQLLTFQEKERKRIVQELHDSVGQMLSALKYSVESTLNQISKRIPRESAQSLEALIPKIQSTVEEVEKIGMGLRPSILDDLGIIATFSWFCREFETVYSNIHIEQEITLEEKEVPEPLKVVMYRILQESLNNITKHSRANYVYISLKKKDRTIELAIRDNGRGFDLERTFSPDRYKNGVGLISMIKRAELSGGSLVIKSDKEAGTTIQALWPC